MTSVYVNVEGDLTDARYPRLLPHATDQEIYAEQERVIARSLPIKHIYFPVGLVLDGDQPPRQIRHDFPPMLLLDAMGGQLSETDRCRLLHWFQLRGHSFDRSAGDVHSNWLIVSSPDRAFAFLYLDVTHIPAAGSPPITIPFHLTFRLDDPVHIRAIKAIDRRCLMDVTIDELDQEGAVGFMIDVSTIEQAGISLQITSSFTQALLKMPALRQIAEREGMAGVWAVIVPETATAAPPATERTVALPPGTTYTFTALERTLRGRICSRLVGEVPGGRVFLAYDPMVFEAELLGIQHRDHPCGIMPADAEGSVFRNAIQREVKVRQGQGRSASYATKQAYLPGWHSRSLVGLVWMDGMWVWGWELCIQWREHDQADPVDRAMYILLSVLQEGRSRMRTAFPHGLLVATLFLARSCAQRDLEAVFYWCRTIESVEQRIVPFIFGARYLWVQRHGRAQGPEDAALNQETREVMHRLSLLMGTRLADMARQTTLDRFMLHAIDAAAMALWHAKGTITQQQLFRDALDGQPHVLRAFTVMAAMSMISLWSEPPISFHPTSLILPNKDAVDVVLTASVQCWLQQQTLLDPYAPRLSSTEQAFLSRNLFAHVWYPWNESQIAEEDRWPYTFTDASRQRVAELCTSLLHQADQGSYQVRGRYTVHLPETFERLAAIGSTVVRISAMERAIWIRIGPDEPDGGLILPFVPHATPLMSWSMLLPPGILWELHLAMMAWYRDMRVAGEPRILVPREPSPLREHPEPHQVTRRATSKRKAILYVPRRPVRRLHRGSTDPEGVDPTASEYGSKPEREAIRSRQLNVQSIRPHPFNPAKRQKFTASPTKRRAWELLSDATRLEIAGQLAFPEQGTIRGLQLHVDPETGEERVRWGYQRGHQRDDAPATTVHAAGLESVALLLKLINADESREQQAPDQEQVAGA